MPSNGAGGAGFWDNKSYDSPSQARRHRQLLYGGGSHFRRRVRRGVASRRSARASQANPGGMTVPGQGRRQQPRQLLLHRAVGAGLLRAVPVVGVGRHGGIRLVQGRQPEQNRTRLLPKAGIRRGPIVTTTGASSRKARSRPKSLATSASTTATRVRFDAGNWRESCSLPSRDSTALAVTLGSSPTPTPVLSAC